MQSQIPPKYKAKREKVNVKNTAEIEGEEVQKTFLRGCRTYTEK
jgi:ribosomal protein L20A (L18A)